MQTESIQDILVNLGYNLSDKGKYWQSNAIYRDGDNRTALQIWKDTGIWKDFVANTPYLPFVKLIELSCKNDDELSNILSSLQKSKEVNFIEQIKTPKMETDTFFSHDEVKTLLPHYSFYNKKKISDKTLSLYKAGFSMSGKMNGRFVFPIFDEHERVIGLSGRHLLWKENSALPKWKHLGKKANWIYPINIPNSESVFTNSLEQKKEIILIEGIGDSLALSEQGVYNQMVVFGLDISSKQISFLASQNLDRIIIATNNDANKEENRGLAGAIKIYLKLIKYFDISKVEIKLPIDKSLPECKDFADLFENGCDINTWINKKINKAAQVKYIINFLKDQNAKNKEIEILNDYLEYLNG